MTADPDAPHGRDKQGRALAPYGRKADGTPRIKPGRGKRSGTIEQTRTGWRARYTAPDGTRPSKSFSSNEKGVAQAWLHQEQAKVARGEWKSAEQLAAEGEDRLRQAEADGYTLGEWADEWLRRLKRDGKSAKTIQTYRYRLSAHIRSTFGDRPLRAITEGEVTAWYDALVREQKQGVPRPVAMTLRAMLNEAVRAGRIDRTPYNLPGAAKHRPLKSTHSMIATPEQVRQVANAVSDRLRLAVYLGMWCQLREGEVLELRRRDIDMGNLELLVTRQVQFIVGEGAVITPPKSERGTRTVGIIPELMPFIRSHLLEHAAPGSDGLLFSHPKYKSKHLHHNTFRAAFNRARDQVDGMDAFVFHDLRASGLTQFGQMGATLSELMNRGGHSDVEVAMRYQRADKERDRALTDALGKRFTAGDDADVLDFKRDA